MSGKLSELHIFVRGGYIIPMQNIFDKYILNSYYLRQEKISLIINLDNNGNSKGVIFYDNDESEYNNYYRVDLKFENKILTIKINNRNNFNYKYKDHILDSIEIWRIDQILKEENIKEKSINLKIKIKNKDEYIKGIINNSQNKIIINFNDLSLFDLNEINLNNISY